MVNLVVLLSVLLALPAWGANLRPVFPNTEDKTTGAGVPATSVVKGDTSTNVKGEMCLVGETSGGLLNSLLIDSNRHAAMYLPTDVSASNSSTATLGAGATFTGTFVDALSYACLSIVVKASHASATTGLVVEWSNDGSTVVDDDAFAIPAATGKQYSFGIMSRYVRVKYTNGATPQTSFDLGTYLHRTCFKPSSHKINASIVDDDDAELNKCVISGKSPTGNGYDNANVDASGNLLVRSVQSFDSNNAFGEVATSSISTFPVRKTTYTEQTANAQRSVISSSTSDDGSPAGTGALTLDLFYLDAAATDIVSENITLNGTTCVATAASDIAYIEEMEVGTVGSSGSNVGTITLFATNNCTGTVIGTIAPTDNRTKWAHHYVPVGVTANITGKSGSNTSTQAGNGAQFFIRSRELLVTNAVDEQISGRMRYFAQTSEISRTLTSPLQVVGPALITAWVATEGGGSITNFSSFTYFNEVQQ